jgi:glycosyltransferase involved in cell wall biosynthesis
VRVLILHSRYLSGAVSGENRVVADEATLLRQAGHEVRVLSAEPDDRGLAAQGHAAASAVWSRRAASQVAGIVRSERIEVVHAHNLFPTLSPASLSAAHAAGATVVMTLHNFRLLCLPATFLRDGRVCEDCLGRTPWRGVVHRCYRGSAAGSAALATSLTLHRAVRTFDRVARFLAVSAFVRDKYVEAGFAPERVRVKANFAWPAERRRGPGDYFLFLGRLAPEKGVDTILRAWATLGTRAELVVAGEGPDRDALRAAAPNGVRFLGAVEPGEVPALLAGARALLVPSRWYEASPRTIVEGYACGVPVLASRIGALPEAVADDVTGLLIAPDASRAWADAVLRLCVDRESERLGAGAFGAWNDRHSPAAATAALEGAYAEAVASGS